MPTGPNPEGFRCDSDALNLLEANGYKNKHFVLYHPDANHVETQIEKAAIDYLVTNWDWGWSKTEP